MNWRTALVYGVLAVGALLLLRGVVAFVFGIFGLLWAVLTTAVALVAVGGLLYGGYRLFSWLRGTASSPASDSSTTAASTDGRLERLKQRYADGELSDEEFERRLEQELDGTTGLDRERQPERE